MNEKALQAKKDSVAKISEGIKASKAIAVVSYAGLTVAELTELRRKLAEKNATFGVFKNTLVRRALAENNIEGLDEYLEGPNAFVFSPEVSDGVNVIYKYSRAHESLVLKAGCIEGTIVDAKGLKDVAKLPTKEQLLSMFCMVLNEPISGFARAIKSVAEKNGAPAEETPAAEASAN